MCDHLGMGGYRELRARRARRAIHRQRKGLFVDFGRFTSPYAFGYDDDGAWEQTLSEAEVERLTRKGIRPDTDDGYSDLPFFTKLRYWTILKLLGETRALNQAGWYEGHGDELTGDIDWGWHYYGPDGDPSSPQARLLASEVLDEHGDRFDHVPWENEVSYYYTPTGRLKRREPER